MEISGLASARAVRVNQAFYTPERRAQHSNPGSFKIQAVQILNKEIRDSLSVDCKDTGR